MIIDVMVVHCPGCDNTWDLDRNPDACVCPCADGDEGSEVDKAQEIFVVSLEGDTAHWITACETTTRIELVVQGEGDLRNVVNAWISKFRTARGAGLV